MMESLTHNKIKLFNTRVPVIIWSIYKIFQMIYKTTKTLKHEIQIRQQIPNGTVELKQKALSA